MKLILKSLLLTLVLNLNAQSQTDGSSFLDKTTFKVGYYGNLLYDNGFNLGAEYAWKEKKKVKEKKQGQKIITHQVLLNGSLGFSTNFTSQTDNGLHTHYGLIWRRTNSKSWQLNVELSPLGYYRSLLPETFEVEGDEVSKVRFPGRGYYAPSFAFGIGRLRPEKTHAGWYLNFNITLRTPHNASALPTFALQYGHRFNFKNNAKYDSK